MTLLVGDFGGGKGASIFGLLNGGAHDGNASGMDGDGGIEKIGVVDASEVVKRAGNTAGFGAEKVGGVGKNVQDHGRRTENFQAVRVHRHEAKKALQVRHCGEGVNC